MAYSFSFLRESLHLWRSLCKHNASSNTDNCREKMEYTLLRENHVIEKGMSMRSPRKGFGQLKVIALCKRLQKYKALYANENPDFLKYPLATIKEYIDYIKKEGVNIDEIEKLFTDLSLNVNFEEVKASGIMNANKTDIQNLAAIDFKGFLSSRHSIRYFSKKTPEKETIEKALKLAQSTPSACNRQGWKVHVFSGKECTELLKWQGGARGFEEEPTIALLVTANFRAFLHHEPFQAYIDGGMYAMTLIYALHSVGLGTIPLSCGFNKRKLAKLNSFFNIPSNEVPIEIIAVGEMLDSFNVAVSTRKPVSQTTTIH